MSDAGMIDRQVDALHAGYALMPVTASEIEFYLEGTDSNPRIEAFWQALLAACMHENIPLLKHEAEKGKGQFEIALRPDRPQKTAADTARARALLETLASEYGMRADFSACPYPGQPGSGLHIHIHMCDASGRNQYYKDDARISDALRYSIGGLLAWLNPSMPVFAPAPSSYLRFTGKSNAPVTVSWGANNRTVAIRLPDSERNNKRIEHRVAGADADPVAVIAVILAAIRYGLDHKCEPGAQVYGDASLPMYNLPEIARTLEIAQENMRHAQVFEGYFSLSGLRQAS